MRKLLPNPLQRSADDYGAVVQVNVLPSQPKCLPTPESERQENHPQSFQWVPPERSKEIAGLFEGQPILGPPFMGSTLGTWVRR